MAIYTQQGVVVEGCSWKWQRFGEGVKVKPSRGGVFRGRKGIARNQDGRSFTILEQQL